MTFLFVLFVSVISHAGSLDDFIKWDIETSQSLQWENAELADTISDVGLFVSMGAPVVYAASKKDWKASFGMAGVIGANHLMTSYLKGVFKRERPNKENDRSMPSGHSGDSWSGATLLCGYSRDPNVCAMGFVLAGGVSYLRVAASKHWITDVVAGAGLGILNGTLIPTLMFSW